MEATTRSIIDFMTLHQAYAPWLAVIFAAAETTAFLSILIPSTALLMAVGAAVSTGALPFLPIWIGAAVGALIGSTFSWWLGHRYGAHVLTMWPLRDRPELVDRTADAFRTWGILAVFIGHFFGPLRSVVFLFSGMTRMSFARFQTVNVIGAISWAYVIPKTGELGGNIIGWFWNFLGF
jgi:membrane protein DedA with SNARE-associated domain